MTAPAFIGQTVAMTDGAIAVLRPSGSAELNRLRSWRGQIQDVREEPYPGSFDGHTYTHVTLDGETWVPATVYKAVEDDGA